MRWATAEGSQGARGEAGSGDAGSLEAELRGQGRGRGTQSDEAVERAGDEGSRGRWQQAQVRDNPCGIRCDLRSFQIEMSKEYGINEWQDALQALLILMLR